MGLQAVKAGSTSVIIPDLFLQDSSQTDGRGLSGLLFNSASLTCYYHRNTAATSVAVTLATMTLGTWASGGFKEVDGTNMRGVYSFCPPDAALATGAQSVTFFFKGATNLADTPVCITLQLADPQASVTQTVDVATVKAKTDSLPATPAGVGDPMTLTAAYDFAKGTVAMTESYAGDGMPMTPAQCFHQIWSLLAERTISGATLTTKKLDGSLTSMTFTLDSSTAPTAQTRTG